MTGFEKDVITKLTSMETKLDRALSDIKDNNVLNEKQWTAIRHNRYAIYTISTILAAAGAVLTFFKDKIHHLLG